MNYKQLTENERYQVDVMNQAGHSQKEIAKWLVRSSSTISRALRRNRGLRGYRPCLQQAETTIWHDTNTCPCTTRWSTD